MNRKAVSPVVATILLVAVAVASVSSYWVWFRSFQTQIQEEVEQQSVISPSIKLEVLSINDDGNKYYVTLKNASSSGKISLRNSDFIMDGQNTWIGISPDPSSLDISPGSSRTFVLTPPANRKPTTGTVHSFVFIGSSTAGQVVATISYRDS